MAVSFHGALMSLCLVGMLLGDALGNVALVSIAALILVGDLLTIRLNPSTRMIQESAIRDAECPACGEAIDLVQTWSCPCGFVTWRPRHAFSPCPNCRKVLSWIVCPVCDASIPV